MLNEARTCNLSFVLVVCSSSRCTTPKKNQWHTASKHTSTNFTDEAHVHTRCFGYDWDKQHLMTCTMCRKTGKLNGGVAGGLNQVACNYLLLCPLLDDKKCQFLWPIILQYISWSLRVFPSDGVVRNFCPHAGGT